MEKEETGAYEEKLKVSVDGEEARFPVCADAGKRNRRIRRRTGNRT